MARMLGVDDLGSIRGAMDGARAIHCTLNVNKVIRVLLVGASRGGEEGEVGKNASKDASEGSKDGGDDTKGHLVATLTDGTAALKDEEVEGLGGVAVSGGDAPDGDGGGYGANEARDDVGRDSLGVVQLVEELSAQNVRLGGEGDDADDGTGHDGTIGVVEDGASSADDDTSGHRSDLDLVEGEPAARGRGGTGVHEADRDSAHDGHDGVEVRAEERASASHGNVSGGDANLGVHVGGVGGVEDGEADKDEGDANQLHDTSVLVLAHIHGVGLVAKDEAGGDDTKDTTEDVDKGSAAIVVDAELDGNHVVGSREEDLEHGNEVGLCKREAASHGRVGDHASGSDVGGVDEVVPLKGDRRPGVLRISQACHAAHGPEADEEDGELHGSGADGEGVADGLPGVVNVADKGEAEASEDEESEENVESETAGKGLLVRAEGGAAVAYIEGTAKSGAAAVKAEGSNLGEKDKVACMVASDAEIAGGLIARHF